MRPSERSRLIRSLISEHGLDNFLEEVAEECDAAARRLRRNPAPGRVAVLPKKEVAAYHERLAHKFLDRRNRIMEIATGIREGKI